jgi:DNA modification methylase
LWDEETNNMVIKTEIVDLIVTSPPYADQRKNTYRGIRPDKYVEWFLQISIQLLRVLKPTGTFILNIKEKVVDGERSMYVMELILAMRKTRLIMDRSIANRMKRAVINLNAPFRVELSTSFPYTSHIALWAYK